MQTSGDRTDFPAGSAVSSRSTADLSDINDPFTEYDALMRERDALVYHRQMLKRKRTELKQSLKRQRSENELCPALFVFPSAEDLVMSTQSDRVRRSFSTHGAAHRDLMLRGLELNVPPFSEAMVQHISQLETEMQMEYIAIRLRRVTPALKTLCILTSLRTLDLSHTKITNEDLSSLRGNRNLVELNLSYCCGMTDISPISHITTLELVKLSGCQRLVGFGALGRLPRLSVLLLSETPVTDEDMRLLSESNTLVKIGLHSCGALTNVNPLSSIATLEVIILSWCTSLTHVGGLGKLPALKEVCLSRTPITDEEVSLLSECHTLKKIGLHSCEALTNVNPLSSIATLEVINLSWCTSLTHVGGLGKLPVLKEIGLSVAPITDEEVSLLSECHTLKKIDLHSCKALTNVNPLSSIETLEVIKLWNCSSLTHVGELGKLPALKEVCLSRTPITDEEVSLLSECHTLKKIGLHSCEALTNVNPLSSIATLEVINLSWCTSLTHVGGLGKLPVLKEIGLSVAPITDEEVSLLSECHTLKKIDLHSCKALTNVNPLSSIETLEVIKLWNCSSLTHVGELGKLPALKAVNLSRTPITNEDVKALKAPRELLDLPPINSFRWP